MFSVPYNQKEVVSLEASMGETRHWASETFETFSHRRFDE